MASSVLPSASVRINNPMPGGLVKIARARRRLRSSSLRMRRERLTPFPEGIRTR